jgi:type I restriction enzyme S subunit
MRYNWPEVKLSELCSYRQERVAVDELTVENYISTANMLPNKGGIEPTESLPSSSTANRYYAGDVLISNIRPYFKKAWYATTDGGCSSDVLVLRAKGDVHPEFLYYLLTSDTFFSYMTATSKGTKMPRGDKQAIMNWRARKPPLPTQRAIADTLSCLDAKIDLNIRINDNLEKQAQAIFKNWFVDFEPFLDAEFVDSSIGPIPDGWIVKALDEVADYVNGLAMQRYRPQDNEEGLPVIKIRELRQGFADESSDRCTAAIEDDYVIDDGDIVFSWSGTLMVDIWTGGRAGLNQHLFKVSSRNYPRWFYYLWTKFHIEYFRHIADSRATTMGHIKRSHLKEAKVLVPDAISLEWMTALMEPLIDMQMTRRMENRVLASLRDVLRPALLSGEIEVPVVYHE